MTALELGRNTPGATDAGWQHEPLKSLTHYIVTRHHQYVRSEVPRIQRWLDKAVAAHGQRHPELLEIRHTFSGMAGEMAQHMAKEELILFPAIQRLEGPAPDSGHAPEQCFESLAQPVRMMMLEHDHSGRDLAEISRLSGEYTPPPDACATYRVLYHALEEFERDLRRHVHLENNVLFPRALQLKTSHV